MLVGVLAQQHVEVALRELEARIDFRYRLARSLIVRLGNENRLLASQLLLVGIAGLLRRLQLDARGFDRSVQLRDSSEVVLALTLR